MFDDHLDSNARMFDFIRENRSLMLENRNLMMDHNSLVVENDRMADRIMALEFERDELIDNESILKKRIEYWRKQFRKLQAKHSKCSEKSIILYR